MKNPAIILALMATTIVAGTNTSSSIYTPLSGKSCILVKEDKEAGSTVHSCPGPSSDIKTLVAYDDQRMSISLVLPGATQEIPLNLWSVVTPSFSSLGSKAEWRVDRQSGKTPFALIVRVNATNSESKKSSYLAIAKIAQDQACVVEVIPVSAQGDANSQARRSADQSTEKDCLKGEK